MSGMSMDDDVPLNQLKKAPMKDDDDDVPLNQLKATPSKRVIGDDDDDIPLNKLKTPSTSNSVKKEIKEDDDDLPLSTLKKNTPSSSKSSSTPSSSKTPKASTSVKKERNGDDAPKSKATPTIKKEVKKEEKEGKKSTKKEPVKKEKVKKETASAKKKVKTEKKRKRDDSDEESSSGSSGSESGSEESGGEDGKEKGKRGKKKKDEEDVWEWWKDEPLPKGKTWRSLSHNGVYFPPLYQPHGVKMIYDGEPIALPVAQEEWATYFANYLETDHYKKPAFRKNFWEDFRNTIPKDSPLKKKLVDFDKCDFKPIHAYLMEKKEAKKNRTPEEKKVEKEETEKIRQMYGFCVIDGHRQRVGNYRVEPPGIFLGRGNHPKTGKLKPRTTAKNITINIGKGEKIPQPPPGEQWAGVKHDDSVAWLAMWKEQVNDMFKYVWLSSSSRVKGMSDMAKFDKARKLGGCIDKIRKNYRQNLESNDLLEQQRATALYFIDTLALRVGNEKGEDEADTVGCCSLRIEHIQLAEPDTVKFDFLGKDSVPYQNTVQVDKVVFQNLKKFMHDNKDKAKKKKKPSDDLFDQLTTLSLNKYLKEQMPGLSAKVFRTFNASITLERELAKMPENLKKASVDEKLLFYNRCNKEVAILCNHQKAVSKTFGDSMAKIDAKVQELEDRKKKLNQQLLYLKGKGPKPEMDDDDGSDDEEDTKKAKKKPEPKKEKKVEKEDKGKKRKKEDVSDDENDFESTPKKKRRSLSDDPDVIKNQIEKIDVQINKWNIKKIERDENKTVALGTSKINYLDPRISAAWCKKVGVPIEKIFSKSLREKFPWAMDAAEEFKFASLPTKSAEKGGKEKKEKKEKKAEKKTPKKKKEESSDEEDSSSSDSDD